MSIRHPAVAGIFYPRDPSELRNQVEGLLATNEHSGTLPKVLIVPHAGYIYSGPIAASAYSLLRHAAAQIRKVVLLGPSHRIPFDGIALPSVDVFETPLGTLAIDKGSANKIIALEQVSVSDKAHALEHSLEVHLPFLQVMLNQFSILPLVIGDAEPEEVAEVLDSIWGGDDTLIVVSSDLSHCHSYAEANSIDTQTSDAIQHFESHITNEQACGSNSINGLLVAAKRRNMDISLIDLRNSGDTAGTKHEVVGYGAYELH